MSSDMDTNGEQPTRLEKKVDALSASVDHRFDALSASVDQRFDAQAASVDRRFDEVDAALAEQREYTEFAFHGLKAEVTAGFAAVDGRFNRLERKLDQFIDTQSRANALVERRLTALEPKES